MNGHALIGLEIPYSNGIIFMEATRHCKLSIRTKCHTINRCMTCKNSYDF